MAEVPSEIWMMHTKRADFAHIAAHFGIDPVTARIITNLTWIRQTSLNPATAE